MKPKGWKVGRRHKSRLSGSMKAEIKRVAFANFAKGRHGFRGRVYRRDSKGRFA